MSHLTPPDPELPLRRQQTEVYLDLLRVGRTMLRRSERLFAEEGLDDISPAQAGVLMVLFQERRPMTARELSASLELAEVTVSRFVTALEGAGWIARRPDPGDARARLIRPTQRAYDTLPTFIRISNALLDGAFRGFTHQELAALGRGVARLHRNLASSVRS